jgi:hypothetical protein
MANVLRYPLEAITEETDYLQISLISKSYAGGQGVETIQTRTTTNSSTPGPQGDILKLTRRAGFASGGQGTDVSSRARFPGSEVTAGLNGIILLPMPSNIVDANTVNYSEDTLDSVTALAGGVALNAMKTNFSDNFLTDIENRIRAAVSGSTVTGGDLKRIYLGNLAAQAAGIAGVGNITLNQILARGEGQIMNPNMEMLFNGPTIRNFKFSFKMTPRDENESEQIKLIIRSLKKHMSPQEAGTFLKTPNFFELRYRQGNIDHKFLHRFKQCVLSDMSVNYTGENVYATYSDGTPVSMIMDLTFKELEPIYSGDYKDSDTSVGF